MATNNITIDSTIGPDTEAVPAVITTTATTGLMTKLTGKIIIAFNYCRMSNEFVYAIN
jgi:hypothetical protein